MKKPASNLRDVTYRQAAPCPPMAPLPPRRLTSHQKITLDGMRFGALLVGDILFMLTLMCAACTDWENLWPSRAPALILCGVALLTCVIQVVWSTCRLWRDESLGGGE